MDINFDRFLTTLPIIGTSLVGIFGAILALILIVYGLNAVTGRLGKKEDDN